MTWSANNNTSVRFGAQISRVKSLFFDRLRIYKFVDDRTRTFLNHAGALVRKIAKGSIRTRKKPSEPGQPPSSHTGTLKKFLFYSLDPVNRSVVIGPVQTNQIFFDRQDRQPVKGTVPQILEEGGRIGVMFVKRWDHLEGPKAWTRADFRSRRRLAGRKMKLVYFNIRPRPYMEPALLKVIPQLPKLWAESVIGTKAA